MLVHTRSARRHDDDVDGAAADNADAKRQAEHI